MNVGDASGAYVAATDAADIRVPDVGSVIDVVPVVVIVVAKAPEVVNAPPRINALPLIERVPVIETLVVMDKPPVVPDTVNIAGLFVTEGGVMVNVPAEPLTSRPL